MTRVLRRQTLADLRSVAMLAVLADPGRSVARLRSRATSAGRSRTIGHSPTTSTHHLS